MKTKILLLSIVLFWGCSSAPELVNMVPDVSELSLHRSEKAIAVRDVFGGKKTSELTGSRISGLDVLMAMQEAIKESKIFTLKHGKTNVDYFLDVVIIRQDQPVIGLDMTTDLEVKYKITDSSDKLIWKEDIYTEYTAAMCDAFVGSQRLKMANEGAVRENIRIALTKIANLKL